MKLNDRTLFTLGVFVLVLGFLVLSLDYQPRARLVPLIIAVPTLLLTLLQLLIDMVPAVGRRFSFLQEYDLFGIDTGRAAAPSGESCPSGTVFRRELNFAAWLLLLMALIYFIGYLVAIPLFLVLFLRLRSSESWLMTLSITVATWAFVYVVFIVIMGAPLHEGVVWKAVGL
ncbi:MAG: tripartite tricarboxylate transporter TctB family protein [Deltaproteobacteria bacterium]|nr:tripartite tricarboxylate transporter TctB family protein [Deltaproteobacteria bacterium]